MPRSLPDLYRRISRAIDTNRGLRLESEDLDLLCTCGAVATLSQAAAEEQKTRAVERIQKRQRPSPGATTQQAIDHCDRIIETAKQVRREERLARRGIPHD